MRNQPIIDSARKNAPGEAERQGRIADGATVGGAPATTGVTGGYEFTPQEQQEMIRTGMTREMYGKVAEGPVKIDPLAPRKEGK
jgi:hypothetical protein